MRTCLSALAACLCLALAAPAGAATMPQYGNAGRWITDEHGRVAVLHGLNMVSKSAADAYAPDGAGFGDDDGAFLAANGFDVVRLGVMWKALEPTPGGFDETYLNRIVKTSEMLRRHGVATLLDFHQDLFNERFGGAGAPDWAVVGPAATEEPTPQAGFPYNYVVQDAVNHAFDAFWANTPVPATGRGVQDMFADAWAHVARRFVGRPGVVGYNVLNEPWPGTPLKDGLLKGCATTTTSCGLVDFEATKLTAFHRRVAKAIRRVDPRTVIWAAPTLAADFGAASGNGRIDDHSGFAPNAYCAQAAGLDGVVQFVKGRTCRYSAELSFRNAETVSRRNGQAIFFTEFGSSDTLTKWQDYIDGADRHMVSWTYWSYGKPEPSDEGLVDNTRNPPAGANVKTAKLMLLARPHPAAISGTPARWAWAAATRTFTFAYTPRRAGGGRAFRAGSVTEVRVPRIQYPSGYGVRVRGARVLSAENAPGLRLALCGSARAVTVMVAPGRTAAAARRCG